jgi:hypothetical protein
MAAQAGKKLGTSFTIVADTPREVSPAIAYNSQRKEYLVVWYNDREGNDDVRAQRVRYDGKLLGPLFYISAENVERRYPDVAYNSKHDQYLVVWEQNSISEGYSIKGRRVSGTGQVLDTTDIIIRSSGYNLYTPVKPAVDYAYTSDRYLVVWAETWHPLPISYSIEGQVMDHNGNLEGSRFTLRQSDESVEEPDLAYNRHANRYLVVWQKQAGTIYAIEGRQALGGGGTYQTGFTIYYQTMSASNPAVACLPTSSFDEKFLVVFAVMYIPPNNHHIYGQMVKENGNVGIASYISWMTVDETMPAVAGNEDGQQYFVAWQHPQGVVDKPIKGRSVIFTGAYNLGEVEEFSAPAAYNPAVAAGAFGDFLVAWQNQPVFGTNQNIYGQLWGNRIYLPTMKK